MTRLDGNRTHDAGWSKENLVDAIVTIGDKTVTNYLDVTTNVPVDFPAAPLLSRRPSVILSSDYRCSGLGCLCSSQGGCDARGNPDQQTGNGRFPKIVASLCQPNQSKKARAHLARANGLCNTAREENAAAIFENRL